MNNLSTLKRLAQNELVEGLSPLENLVVEFLKGENSKAALAVKQMTPVELTEALEHYLDDSTAPLWLTVLSLSNLPIFLKTPNSEFKKLVLDWFFNEQESKQISGKVNCQTLNFKLDNDLLKSLFLSIDIPIDVSELVNFQKQLRELDENLDQWVEAKLVKTQEKTFVLQMGSGENQEGERITWWNENLTKPLQALTMCVALMATPALAQERDSKEALNYATKAAMAHPDIKGQVESVVDNLEHKAKKVVRESGTEIPVSVVGYGVKAAVDKEIELKTGEGTAMGHNFRYDVIIGFDGSYRMGITGKTPIENSQYKIQGVRTNNEQIVEMRLNFEF